MYVYIKYGNLIKRFRNVNLSDCYLPKVDGVSVEKIEPALWFKVLILDSLFVDCDGRDVFWNTETSIDADRIHKTKDFELTVDKMMSFFTTKGKIFEEEGCYDYDVFVDELFDSAGSIVIEMDKHNKKHDPTWLVEINQKLLRLLHVFILPALKLRECELNDLQKILSWIEHKHNAVEITIGKKDKTKYNVENSLREQRGRLLENHNFGSQQYVATCDPEFLETFLKHLQKDISVLNDKLVTYDKEIVPLRDSLGEEDLNRLRRWRKERDQTLAYIDRALEARETIKNVIGRPHILKKKIKLSKRPTSQPFHVMYVEITERIQEINKEIQELINAKIQISSVREATLLAIDELIEYGESYGYERKAGKFEFETDIYDPKNKPEEWSTLSEKVADLLTAKPIGFRDKYDKFCRMIKLKCQCLFDDSKLFSSVDRTDGNDFHSSAPLSPGTAQVIDMLAQSSLERRSQRYTNYLHHPAQRDKIRSDAKSRSYSSRFSFGSIPKEQSESICKEIIAHMSEMTEALAEAVHRRPFNEIQRSTVNKIYICYESHISTELMPVLHQLYEQSYRQQCEGLSRWISQISFSDIGFDDKKFEALVFPPNTKHAVNQRETEHLHHEEETEIKVPFGEERKSYSLEELAKISVDDLYKYTDMETVDRQSKFSCAPGMDGWTEIVSGSENRASIETSETKEAIAQRDAVFMSETEVIEPGSSPTDNLMNFAEDFITDTSKTASRRKVKLVNEREELNDGHVTRCTGLSDNLQTSFPNDLPSYEDVIMRRSSPPPAYKTDSPVKAAFFQAFEKFETIVKKENEAISLFKKLRVMTKAIRYVEKQIASLRHNGDSNVLVCADDILDIVILLLSRLDSDTMLQLYAHINLMIHLSPTFMHGNAHDYALVTFSVAYQHMFEQHVLHKSPKT